MADSKHPTTHATTASARAASRRRFLAQIAAATAAAGLAATATARPDAVERLLMQNAGAPGSATQGRPVNPFIGTGWRGHTYPGATAPFGLVQLSPDSAGGPRNARYGWDHCSGYHYPDTFIRGFSHTHLQGTGAMDLGDVLIMPFVPGKNDGWTAGTPGHGYASAFSHNTESARAGYYGVTLETPDVKAELTATTRCGMHRYTFPKLSQSHPVESGFILDLVHGLGCHVYHAQLNIESPTKITGVRYTHGWAANKQVYFAIECSRPMFDVHAKGVAAPDIITDGKAATPGQSRFTGLEIRAKFFWANDAMAQTPLLIKVGISPTGIAGARKNLAAEMPHWDFDAIAGQTAAEWEKALNVLDAKLPTKKLDAAFYTGAYHGMTAPATFNDVDGTYRGQDGKNHSGARNHAHPKFTKYTTLSIWDIYRGEFPFLMLTQPHRTNDVMNTFLADYKQLNQQSLPVWPLWGNETWCMTGFHSAGMILGAYTRGFRGWDVHAMYDAMRVTAMNNRNFQDQFREHGFIPTGPGRQSVSRTLDYAYDYWCVGAMAKLLGKHEDAAMFEKFGQNYRNLFDPATGFMRGRSLNGQWREPFRPDQEYWHDYTESDAWQATFNVMQDVPGLIKLFGGDQPFIAKLDALFTAPTKLYNAPPDISGMVGQDAQGNEPSNHIPYLYNFAGAAWKTQYWARKVMARWYTDTPEGIPGNDDCGQLSSWFVLGAMGFYPVNAATGVYVLGSPVIHRVKIRNPATGKIFTIIAENNSAQNVYVQKVSFNGRDLPRSWITHQQITAGGELVFTMGHKPNKEWASAVADRPPSGLA